MEKTSSPGFTPDNDYLRVAQELRTLRTEGVLKEARATRSVLNAIDWAGEKPLRTRILEVIGGENGDVVVGLDVSDDDNGEEQANQNDQAAA